MRTTLRDELTPLILIRGEIALDDVPPPSEGGISENVYYIIS